jgi:hypothetical protein
MVRESVDPLGRPAVTELETVSPGSFLIAIGGRARLGDFGPALHFSNALEVALLRPEEEVRGRQGAVLKHLLSTASGSEYVVTNEPECLVDLHTGLDQTTG